MFMPQAPTNHLALNGTVNGRSLEVTGKDIPQAVKVPSLDLTMTPQDIRSNPVHRHLRRHHAGRADEYCAVHLAVAHR